MGSVPRSYGYVSLSLPVIPASLPCSTHTILFKLRKLIFLVVATMSMLRNANLIAPYGTETEIEDRTPPPAQPQRGRLAPSKKRSRSSSTSSSRISYSSSSSEEDHTHQHRRRHGAHAHKDHRSTNKRRNRGVKRRTSRREHTRRHRDRRSSGESMSSDTTINSDKDLDLPPVSYGGKVGDSVCKTIVKNIKKEYT